MAAPDAKALLVERDALLARVEELEATLRFDAAAGERMRLMVAGREESGRAVVGRMVRRLAQTEGRAATVEALLNLAAACRAWARQLAESEAERDRAA